MNQIDFTQPGGFPLDQDVFGLMQQNIFLAGQSSSLAGPLAILSGCVVTSNTVSNGYVVINGEILPFVGTTIDTKVIIYETRNNLNYEDGVARSSEIIRYATFGDDGVTNYLWVNFTRHTLQSLYAELQNLNTTLLAQIATKSAIGHSHSLPSLGILKRAVVDIGDPCGKPTGYYNDFVTVLTINGSDESIRILFGETLTTANYAVYATLLSTGTDFNQDNDISYVIRNRTTMSFDVGIREYNNVTQSLSLMYMIVAL